MYIYIPFLSLRYSLSISGKIEGTISMEIQMSQVILTLIFSNMTEYYRIKGV